MNKRWIDSILELRFQFLLPYYRDFQRGKDDHQEN